MGNEERVSMEEPLPAEGSSGEAAEKSPAEAGAGEPAEAREPELSPDKMVLLLEDARAKADEHWQALLRAKAEIDNLRKRSRRDVENAHKFGLEKFVAEVLPVLDSMELGLSAASEEGVDGEKVREGLELTLRMLQTAVDKFGVTEINPEGERFDPERHQAMTMQETDAVEPGTVVSVIQKGYLLNDRLVRPALVIVAKETAAS